MRAGRPPHRLSFGDGFQAHQAVEGAVELVLEAGFGAIHQLDGTTGIAGAAVGESCAGWGGQAGGAGIQGIFVVDAGGFEIERADESPAGSRHGFDEGGFGWRDGFVFRVERFDEGLETRGALAPEDDTFGEKIVADGVAGNYGFSEG